MWAVIDEAPEFAPLTRAWRSAFGADNEPVREVLLDLSGDRSVRFHTIPDESEFSDVPEDVDELVRRNMAIVEALGGASKLVIVSCHGDESNLHESSRQSWAVFQGLERWKTLRRANPEPDGTRIEELDVFVERVCAPSGELEELFRGVAAERRPVEFLAPKTFEWAVAPYSGGVDVIARSPRERDSLVTRFLDWLPTAQERATERLTWRFLDGLDVIEAQLVAAGWPRLAAALSELIGEVHRRERPPYGTWYGIAYRKHGRGVDLEFAGHHADIDVDDQHRVIVDPWKVAMPGPHSGLRLDPTEVAIVLREATRQGRVTAQGEVFVWPGEMPAPTCP